MGKPCENCHKNQGGINSPDCCGKYLEEETQADLVREVIDKVVNCPNGNGFFTILTEFTISRKIK